jgi:hypothetical protein
LKPQPAQTGTICDELRLEVTGGDDEENKTSFEQLRDLKNVSVDENVSF